MSMTVPVLLLFLSTIYKWIRLEKRENKKWSWVILLLQFWPQWRAIRVMRLDFKNDPRTDDKKKELMREVTTTEPFLEAWPSIIIMTMIWMYADKKHGFNDYCRDNSWHDEECHEYNHSDYLPPNYCKNHPEDNRCVFPLERCSMLLLCRPNQKGRM